MTKPVYYIYQTVKQTNEEVKRKSKLLMEAGFRVVIISDGEEEDLTSGLERIVCENLSYGTEGSGV